MTKVVDLKLFVKTRREGKRLVSRFFLRNAFLREIEILFKSKIRNSNSKVE